MKQRRAPVAPLIALTLLAFASSACASMQQRVQQSENRAQTLEAQVADLQATQQDVINMITMLRADLENALDPIHAQQASGGADLRTLQTDLNNLQEQVRILTEQLEAAEAAAAERREAPVVEAAPERGVAMPPAGGTPPVRPTDPPEADSVGAVGAGDEAPASADEQLFNDAYRDYTASEYTLAISGFEELLGQYPESPRAADALYWIGESLAAQELHAEARRRFLDVTQRFPASPKVPDAMLRAALEAVEMGQNDDAVRELRQLVAAHGRSDAALIGCMQLDRLGEQLPAGCRLP